MKTAKNLSGGSSYPENKNCKQILAGAQTAHSVSAYKFDDLT